MHFILLFRIRLFGFSLGILVSGLFCSFSIYLLCRFLLPPPHFAAQAPVLAPPSAFSLFISSSVCSTASASALPVSSCACSAVSLQPAAQFLLSALQLRIQPAAQAPVLARRFGFSLLAQFLSSAPRLQLLPAAQAPVLGSRILLKKRECWRLIFLHPSRYLFTSSR